MRGGFGSMLNKQLNAWNPSERVVNGMATGARLAGRGMLAGVKAIGLKAAGLPGMPLVGDMIMPSTANAMDDAEAIRKWQPK